MPRVCLRAAVLPFLVVANCAAATEPQMTFEPRTGGHAILTPLAGYQDMPGTAAKSARPIKYDGSHETGTVVISTSRRRLYLVTGPGGALEYRIAVGKEGYAWSGTEKVSRKMMWPDWRPPVEMRRRRPDLPAFVEGGPTNPLGARALYLGSSLYRIHGSNEPNTIGRAVSSGCIRLTNEDVIDLYERVPIGATVVVQP